MGHSSLSPPASSSPLKNGASFRSSTIFLIVRGSPASAIGGWARQASRARTRGCEGMPRKPLCIRCAHCEFSGSCRGRRWAGSMAGRLPLLPLPDCVWPMIAGGVFLPAANSSQGPDGACGVEAQSWWPPGWLLRTFIDGRFHPRTSPLFSPGADDEVREKTFTAREVVFDQPRFTQVNEFLNENTVHASPCHHQRRVTTFISTLRQPRACRNAVVAQRRVRKHALL